MERLALTQASVEDAAARAGALLPAGGVILYPTDTLYGLGADALSDEAIAKLYSIKERDGSKPIHCIVADLAMAQTYGEFNETGRRLVKEFLPGPLTIVVEKKQGIDSGIARNIETIGIRIPDNEFCIALAREFGKPYTTTSANVSGMETPTIVEEILKQLSSLGFVNPNSGLRNPNIGNEATDAIDLVIDAGELPASAPSTVVGVSGTDVVILREGAIPAGEIFEALGKLLPERDGL